MLNTETNTPAEPDWNEIAPILDEALESLSTKDHDAIVLRFLENKTLKDVASVLSTTEDAARMRVNRALESLRNFFDRRGVVISAGALAAVLASNAIRAAPVALTSSALATALSASKASTSLAIGTTKIIAMNSFQKIAASLVVTAALGTAVYQHRQTAYALAAETALRTSHAELANQYREAQATSTLLSNQLAAIQDENLGLRSGESKNELLKLRGEVATLRNKLSEAEQSRLHSPPPASASSPTPAVDDPLIQYLGAAVAPDVNTNQAFTKAALTDALQLAAANAGVSLRSLTIDDSEFPPIVGVKCESEESLEKLTKELRKLPGYEYSGGVGSHTATAFSLVPYRSIPADAQQRSFRRVIVREGMLYSKLD